MNQRTITLILIVLLGLSAGFAHAQPSYENAESKRIIEAMVKAHGGIERWRAAESIRFDNVMHNNYHGKNEFAWWVAHEVIDQKTRKAWQEWPMDDAKIGFDGEQVWSQNWQRSNPPAMMVHFFYYFVNLPWITQDDGVQLSAPSLFEWPGADRELHEITMRFAQGRDVGKSANDYFVLYIDPQSYRLVGYQYATGYRPFLTLVGLPEERKVFGPLWRTITRYEEVDGLLFPAAFHTSPEVGERIVGNHVILNIDISKPFDQAQAAVPEGAQIYPGPLHTQ